MARKHVRSAAKPPAGSPASGALRARPPKPDPSQPASTTGVGDAGRRGALLGEAGLLLLAGWHLGWRVEPALRYEQSAPPFFLDAHFFARFPGAPGGLLDYLAAGVAQLNFHNWLGAAAFTVILGGMLLCARRIFARVTAAEATAPACGLVALLAALPGRYESELERTLLGILVPLGAASVWLAAPTTWRAVRWAGGWVLTAAVFYVAGTLPATLFVMLVALHELAVRRQPWPALARCGIARLNSDGSVDEAFIPPSLILSDDPAYSVGHLHVLPDRRVLIAGRFSGQSQALAYVARLHADGSFDSTFVPELPERRDIRTMAVQADGRILLAARFPTGTNWGGRLLRLTADGAVDPTVQPGVGEGINALAVQPDGRILVATNSRVSGGVVRLHPDGARDLSWPAPAGTGGEYPETRTLFVQPDGQVILAGAWQAVGGIPRPGIARLNNDASGCRLRVRDGLTPEGYFRLEFTGIRGGRYLIETSDDLRDWIPWILLDDPVSPLDLLDPTAGDADRRFYRARLEP